MNFRAGNRALRAFTLVELMIVILIIGVVTGIMIAEMGGAYEDELLRANARKLIAVCDTASNRAIAVHEPQVLRVNTTSGKFVVQPKLDDSQAADTQITEGELDNRIVLVIREPAREQPEEAGDAEPTADANAITFYPDGSADAREFALRDRMGIELVLRINPATSRVRIIEMAAQ